MPRLYASDNDPLDFCQDCWRKFAYTEDMAREEWGHRGDGPDGRGDCFEWDAEHPNYEHEDYLCSICGEELTFDDNDIAKRQT